MQFVRNGNLYQVVRITGPTHNVLGIEFAEPGVAPLDVVIEASEANPRETPRLAATAVRDNVLLGVQDANVELETTLVVKRIRFVPADSPPSETYRLLARSIVHRLVQGEPFSPSTKPST